VHALLIGVVTPAVDAGDADAPEHGIDLVLEAAPGLAALEPFEEFPVDPGDLPEGPALVPPELQDRSVRLAARRPGVILG